MDIETAAAVKLFFPNPSLALLYFEAIANALDAGAKRIDVQIKIASYSRPETLEVTITDDGSGFTDESYSRFKTLLRPRDSFHKGVGRLVYLKYFSRVEIDSAWGKKRRRFQFEPHFNNGAELEQLPKDHPNRTCLAFKGFLGKSIHSYDDLKPSSLRQKIISHFLPMLNERRRKGEDFEISLSLETEGRQSQKEFFPHIATITAADLPILIEKSISASEVDMFEPIKIHYYINSGASGLEHLIAFCVDGRSIPVRLIQSSAIPSNFQCIFLFESEIFNASADSSRQKLRLPDNLPEPQLYSVLRREVANILAKQIPEIASANETTRLKIERQFPHLLGLFEPEVVGLIDRDEAISVAQNRFFQNQKEVLQCEDVSDSIYEKSLDLSSRTLTEYILYRAKIIDKMKSMTRENTEAELHNLIVPRYRSFSGSDLSEEVYQNNAWLLDDRFMSFKTILSDKRMNDVVSAILQDDERRVEPDRPDIAIIFSGDPDSTVPVDVVVVEVKKKTDDKKENQYAIVQLLDRAKKLVEYCPIIERMWYYALLEVNEELQFLLTQMEFSKLYSKGDVFYKEYKTPRPDGTIALTPLVVMSFDSVVADADCRNHAFLEVLRTAMKKHVSSHQPTPPSGA